MRGLIEAPMVVVDHHARRRTTRSSFKIQVMMENKWRRIGVRVAAAAPPTPSQ